MSPEQCRGEQLDARSDIYSFGCVIYQALSGRPPFDGENPVRVLLKHISEKPALQIKTDRAGAALRSIVLRCLEKEPSERYQNAFFLLKDLEKIRDGKRIFSIRRLISKRRLRTVIPVIAALALCVPVGDYLLKLNQNQKLESHVKPRPQEFEGRNLIALNAAIEKSPNNASLYFARGKLHALRDERKNGIDDFTRAIELNPKYADALIERSILSMMMADYPKAMSDAKAALQIEPDSPSARCQLGVLYRCTEQFSKAVEQFEAANRLKPSYNSYSGLGRALFDLARYDEAEKAFSKARELKPQNLSTYILLTMAIYRQDEQQARVFFDRLIAEQDKRSTDWGFIAYYQIWHGNFAEGQKAIEQMKASETFPARGYRIAGDLYRVAGRPEQAVEELSASTSLEEYPPGYRERALAYITLGELRSAEEDLERTLKLNPNSSITLSLLALVESKLGQKQKANELIGRAFVDGSVQPPIVYANRARIELMQGLKQAALQDANQAIKRDPWLKDGYQVRADVEKSLGDLEASGRDQTKAKALFTHLDTV
jgi:tetratricopeptide (TPR) repeat protein